jgi:hypothetical protein
LQLSRPNQRPRGAPVGQQRDGVIHTDALRHLDQAGHIDSDALCVAAGPARTGHHSAAEPCLIDTGAQRRHNSSDTIAGDHRQPAIWHATSTSDAPNSLIMTACIAVSSLSKHPAC